MVHTSQQNDVVEMMNMTLLERSRSMLSNASLCKEFWTEAINTSCYLVNRSPTTSIELKTPEEVWSGKPTDYSNLRVFGCPVYAHMNEGKLELISKKCVFVGYPENVKGYRLWCPESSKFLISRDIIFNESVILKANDVAPSLTIKENETVEKKVEFEEPIQEGDDVISHDDANLE